MSSILTNTAATSALHALRSINDDLATTQNRISTGLKVESAKDNAAAFSISETMKSDNAMYAAIDEGLTQTKNSVSTARAGAEAVLDFSSQIAERVAFAQAEGVDRDKVQEEISGLVKQIETTISQATFNGNDLVNAEGMATPPTEDYTADPSGGATITAVTGISRAGGNFETTSIEVNGADLAQIAANMKAIDITGGLDATAMATQLQNAETTVGFVNEMATSLGVAEKSIENQQDFLKTLTANIDEGIGKMVDANMEEEAARLKSLQTQQQLSNQSLSIANNAPQQLLSLFR